MTTRRSGRILGSAASALTALLAGAACSSGSAPAPPTTAASTTAPAATTAATPAATTAATPTATTDPSPATAADWPTYHRTNDRTGQVTGGGSIRRMARAWTANLDGAVYGQPLFVAGLVIAATEGDSVYGLDPGTGAVRWRRSVGTPVPLRELPCGNIDPLGITGTPAYDHVTGTVFVAAETRRGTGVGHDLVALDPRSGTVRFTRDLDVVAGRDVRNEQQRGALAVANGRVYVPFGGLDGDCGNYVGYVAAVDVHGSGGTAAYAVPTRREGGIWAASGVAVDAAGDVWVAVGNGASFDEPYDGSDSVLRLAPDLGRRLDFFAPQEWGSENAADADLGSTGPMLIDGGRALVSGKNGNVYLLDTARLGGIGGELARLGGCRGFGGLAWDAGARAAFVPCTQGLLRVDVSSTGLTAGWRADQDVNGSPVVGAGAVWSLNRAEGTLHALDEGTGRDLATASVGEVSRFASPVVAGGRVLVPGMHGIVALTVS